MRIQNNITAMNSHRMYSINNASIAKNVEKLSSGYRINRAGDDAAGLAISEKMRAQIRGLNMASKNAQDGVSLIQTAEAGLQSADNILQRMRELSVQAANDTNQKEVDREAIQAEIEELTKELDRIAHTTDFNKRTLLDGSLSGDTSTNSLKGTMPDRVSNLVTGMIWTGTESAPEAETDRTFIINGGIKATVTNTIDFTNDEAVAAGDLDVTFGKDKINVSWELGDSEDDVMDKVAAAYKELVGDDFEVTTGATGIGTITLTAKGAGSRYTTALNSLATVEGTTVAGNNNTADKLVKGTVTAGTDPTIDASGYYSYDDGATRTAIDAADWSVTDNGNGTFTFSNAKAQASFIASKELAEQGGNFILPAPGEEETTGGLNLQVGANSGWDQVIKVNIQGISATKLGISGNMKTTKESGVTGESNLDMSSTESAQAAIDKIDSALNMVNEQRGQLGAVQNRLEYSITNLDSAAENLQSAESRIRDVDMAKEMTQFMKNNILAQASTSMLAQANSLSQGVLSLLG